jgi:hypothetical protein
MSVELPVYGLIKPALDAHTMGIQTIADLLIECQFPVELADAGTSRALELYQDENKRQLVLDWITRRKISRLGISYRLDEADAVRMTGYLVEALKKGRLFRFQGGPLDLIFFAGLPAACQAIDRAHRGLVVTFKGGESPRDTLLQMGVAEDRIPRGLEESNLYDQARLEFGKRLIDAQEYTAWKPADRAAYPTFGSRFDSVTERIDANLTSSFAPLIRAHVGPYSSSVSRRESVDAFAQWVKELAASGFLDILSIGSSQLTQSHFGEDWQDLPNGGGVPINSPLEYQAIYEASRPMLVRTYAGTKNIPQLAAMHEQILNICWHALSLWWFNQLDGRGPYDLYANLKQHLETLDYIARTGKPFEANVSHHFAFRGADDLTYIVSAYLAAKLAKQKGIRTFILQNMLNTPRLTWGIQDLAKSRALLATVRSLEDRDFRVLLQPRAGLDYFKPDLYQARIQLAAVTALMDDIEPYDQSSPPIVHVVSYSEASHLATPDIIAESAQITQHAIDLYRSLRRTGEVDDMGRHEGVRTRTADLIRSAREIIQAMEDSVPDLYTAEGFYTLFAAGFLPVPFLWGDDAGEFRRASNWQSRSIDGGMRLVDEKTAKPLTVTERIDKARANLTDACYALGQRMGRSDAT